MKVRLQPWEAKRTRREVPAHHLKRFVPEAHHPEDAAFAKSKVTLESGSGGRKEHRKVEIPRGYPPEGIGHLGVEGPLVSNQSEQR